jgi:hypothetical protein
MKRLAVYTNKGQIDKDGDESCSVFDAPLYVGDQTDEMNPDFLDAVDKMFDKQQKSAPKFVVVEQADD